MLHITLAYLSFILIQYLKRGWGALEPPTNLDCG